MAEIEQELDAGACDTGNTSDVPLEDGLRNDEYGMDDIDSESDVLVIREELGEDFVLQLECAGCILGDGGGNVDEPKVVVLNPKKDCFSRWLLIVVDWARCQYKNCSRE